MAMSYKDKLVWLDKNHATLKDNPNVELIFPETAEEGIVDKILGMLMKPPTKDN